MVKDVTERFQDGRVAEADGYALQFGCVSVLLTMVNGNVVYEVPGALKRNHDEVAIRPR